MRLPSHKAFLQSSLSKSGQYVAKCCHFREMFKITFPFVLFCFVFSTVLNIQGLLGVLTFNCK